MSEIVIVQRQQRLIIDPPTRTVAIFPDGGIRPSDLAAALAPLPKGILKHHTLTTAFATIATHTTSQDEGLTLTLNEPVGRMLRVTANVRPYTQGGVQALTYTLLRNGVPQTYWQMAAESLSSSFATSNTFVFLVPNSTGGANVVWKLQLKAVNSNTAVNSHGTVNETRQLMIEDLGATVA